MMMMKQLKTHGEIMTTINPMCIVATETNPRTDDKVIVIYIKLPADVIVTPEVGESQRTINNFEWTDDMYNLDSAIYSAEKDSTVQTIAQALKRMKRALDDIPQGCHIIQLPEVINRYEPLTVSTAPGGIVIIRAKVQKSDDFSLVKKKTSTHYDGDMSVAV